MVMLVSGIMISDLEALLLIKNIKPNSLKYWHRMKGNRKRDPEDTTWGESCKRCP